MQGLGTRPRACAARMPGKSPEVTKCMVAQKVSGETITTRNGVRVVGCERVESFPGAIR